MVVSSKADNGGDGGDGGDGFIFLWICSKVYFFFFLGVVVSGEMGEDEIRYGMDTLPYYFTF